MKRRKYRLPYRSYRVRDWPGVWLRRRLGIPSPSEVAVAAAWEVAEDCARWCGVLARALDEPDGQGE